MQSRVFAGVPAPTGAPREPLRLLSTFDASSWPSALAARLFVGDAAVVALALIFGYYARFGSAGVVAVNGLSYLLLGGIIGCGWLVALSGSGAYHWRLMGTGVEEYKRVVTGTFRVWFVVAVLCYAVKLDLARGFVLLAMPLGLALLLLVRAVARRWLVSARARGRLLHRVLVVGDTASVEPLVRELERDRAAGLQVVGACLPGGRAEAINAGVPVLGALRAAGQVARANGVDTVAVASGSATSPEVVRRLAWSLEGTGIELVVAPAVTDVAGPRIAIRPVAGLPLLHVESPELAGGTWLAKQALDRVGAVLLLLGVSPVLLLVGVAVRLTSRGPVFFRQVRIGRDGAEFRVFKFRTMYADAERRLAALRSSNESDGLLFKIEQDPRITPLGRLLRRASLDELPQLLNVVRGEMSLVGPRPLPVKNSDFVGDVRRRLKVRPGITGLWQVAGRSQLSWEDAVRLDLYYVENWSISLDLAIMVRTVGAVLRGTGAC